AVRRRLRDLHPAALELLCAGVRGDQCAPAARLGAHRGRGLPGAHRQARLRGER
ncbi:unnamed protein product, partial [Effrenium voratum]